MTVENQKPNRSHFGVIGLAFAIAAVVAVLVALVWKPSTLPSFASAQATPSNPGKTGGETGTIGTVFGKVVSFDQLTSVEKMKLFEAESKRFEILQEIMADRYVNQFMENYKSSQKLDSVAAAKKEYLAKNTTVPDAKIEEIYQRAKDNPGLANLSEQEKRARIREYLEGQFQQQAMQQLVMDARQKGDLAITLPAPQEPIVEVDDGGNPALGPKDAPVQIIELAEYQCPFCGRMVPTLQKMMKKYDGKVRWVFRDFPLLQMHPEAMPAAVAANCAGRQGKYWEMHNVLFENSDKLTSELYTKIAGDIGLDMAKFQECQKSGKEEEEIMADLELGSNLGVNGTPAYFINGRKLSGMLPEERLFQVIDEELAKKKL